MRLAPASPNSVLASGLRVPDPGAWLATYVLGPDIATGSLVTALDAYEPDAIPIHALYLDRRHLCAAVRSFVEFLQTRFQIPASWDPGKQVALI
ncbi:MAG: hypothetical protein ACREV4_10030 [Gammaproteobacteria bacterium]